jgi:predicted TIM-barrel fold metal-dependent hydrolase
VKAADPLVLPWLTSLREELGGLDLVDAHTHIGANDPDGFKQSPEQLLARLDAAGARGVVFPMHEPAGYREANDVVLEAAAASGGQLTAFCRVDPHRGAVDEARRALDAGARGIKLHPRAEQFALSQPAIRELIALAHERRVPVLIHAGRGIPALGRDTVRLAEDFPGARLILAHAAISDLAWIWRVLPDHPNVYIDTSWWNATDLIALFALAPPGQVLFASDSPYGSVVQAAVCTIRCALQVGLTAEQVRGVAGGQLERLLAGEEPLDLGPAPGPPATPADVLLERVADNLVSALARRVVGNDGDEPVALARLGCAVGPEAEQAGVCASILALLDRSESHRALPEAERLTFSDLHVLATALAVARTPGVAVPDLGAEPVPVREAVDA